MYQNKPDLQQFGVHSLTALYSAWLWPTADWTNPPDPHHSAALLQQSAGIVFLDIENWPTDHVGIQKYLQTIQSFEQFAPSLKFGFYGVSPIRDYWDAIGDPSSSNYKAWQARNDIVAPIAAQANVLFPSIYTFYLDQDGWQRYAIAQIKEARRIGPGKPVYVFLWPQVEDSSEAYMPPDFWRMELDIVRQYADGVVIWGGYQQTWNDDAPWWQQTVSFLQEQTPTR